MKLEKYDETDEALYSRLVFNEETMKMNLGRVFTEEEARMFFRAVLELNAAESYLGYYKCLSLVKERLLTSEWERSVITKNTMLWRLSICCCRNIGIKDMARSWLKYC